ncbi:MAG TPA: MFS transporter [Microvirga sp.]|nr:MFS transporter [Microvirga sp.]
MSEAKPSRALVMASLGLGQILAWGSSYYLPAVLAKPIASDTGWSLPWIVAGLSIGSLTAGLIAPRVGRVIQVRGGGPVMMVGSVLLATGLLALGLAPSLPLHLLAWVVIGGGMGCALYDAAFSTLGRLYGHEARRAIATLTLFGGLASTVCWPLSVFFLERFGWRGTCLAYAALHVGLTLPAYWLALPSRVEVKVQAPRPQARTELPEGGAGSDRPWFIFALLATGIALGWGISSVLSVHLLTILQARGLELAAAVALGVLVGPSQVGGRAAEMVLGKHYHPVWTLLASVVLVAVGLGLLISSTSLTAVALVCYGSGAGVASIARGTLPLVIFGPDQYPLWVGRLAGPTLIAGAVSPALAAVLLDRAGAMITLYVLEGLALVNVIVAVLLYYAQGRGRSPRP